MAKIVTTIPSSGIPVHNQLSGLNEGDYFHLTEEEKISLENAVHKTGNETIDGVKTFVQSPIVPPATASNEAVNLGQLANENNVYISKDFVDVNNTEINGTSVSSGTGVLNNTNVTANNIGVVRLTSSTTANSGYAWRTFSTVIAIKGGEVFTEIFNPLTFTNTTSRMGIHDSTSSAVPSNGVFFRYSGDGLLTLVTANNSVQTTSATIATLSTNTWYKVRFTVNANATSVLGELFDASGTLIASVTQTTNIPTTARRLNLCSITTNSGTTATALLDIDFISVKTTLTR